MVIPMTRMKSILFWLKSKIFQQNLFPLCLAKRSVSNLSHAQPNEGLCQHPHVVKSLAVQENKRHDVHEHHTVSFSGLIQLFWGNWTSNLTYRSPFSNGFRYCGMPSARTTRTDPDSVENEHIQQILIANRDKSRSKTFTEIHWKYIKSEQPWAASVGSSRV